MLEGRLQKPTKRFRVALSFAGENRNFIEAVADKLSAALGRPSVFYDRYYESELARPNLDTYLIRIYHEESELIAIFFCADYAQKEWCGLEWRAIRDVLKQKRDSEIMPFKFDHSEVDGLLSIDGYIEINGKGPADVARLILERLDPAIAHLPPAAGLAKPELDEVEITLDLEFEDFTPAREKRFLQVLKLLLADSDVIIRKRRPGNSITLTLDLSVAKWNILKREVQKGALAEFKPRELRVNGALVFEKEARSFQDWRNKPLAETGARTTIIFNGLRMLLLPALLRDLETRESQGLSNDECSSVKYALNGLVDTVKTYSIDQVVKNAFLEKSNRFSELYSLWNNIYGADYDSLRERRQLVGKLRAGRRKISMVVRQNQNQVSLASPSPQAGDLNRLIDGFGSIVNKSPSGFRHLNIAHRRMLKMMTEKNKRSEARI